MFAVVPLLLIGLALWLERPSRLPRRWTWIVAIAVIALIVVLPLSDLRANANFQAMALVPWVAVSEAIPWPLGGVVLATIAVVLLLRRRARAVWTMLGAVFAVTAVSVAAAFSDQSVGGLYAVFGGSEAQRTWIDDAVGRNARVVAQERRRGRHTCTEQAAAHAPNSSSCTSRRAG